MARGHAKRFIFSCLFSVRQRSVAKWLQGISCDGWMSCPQGSRGCSVPLAHASPSLMAIVRFRVVRRDVCVLSCSIDSIYVIQLKLDRSVDSDRWLLTPGTAEDLSGAVTHQRRRGDL
jgi:hypothetical protein